MYDYLKKITYTLLKKIKKIKLKSQEKIKNQKNLVRLFSSALVTPRRVKGYN